MGQGQGGEGRAILVWPYSTGSKLAGMREATAYFSANTFRHRLAAVLLAEFDSPVSGRGDTDGTAHARTVSGPHQSQSGRRAFARRPPELRGTGYASNAPIASSGTALDSVTIPAAARSRGAIEAM